MSDPAHEPIEKYQEIAEKVRSGEYFQEARQMYDIAVHDPMAERYWFVLITALAALVLLVAFVAVQGLYPLREPVPFIVNSNDPVDDLPRIRSLSAYRGEDPGAALLRFMVQNYVTFREDYDIETFDRNVSGIRSQSSQEVFREYAQQVNPRNPESPIALYQRHSKRRVQILSSRPWGNEESGMEVVFEATVESKTDIKKSRWQANIAFNYSGIALDDEGNVKPVSFIVTEYRTKRIQDVK